MAVSKPNIPVFQHSKTQHVTLWSACMDLLEHNRAAWNRQALAGDRWSIPVDDATVVRARAGDWQVILTPNRPVPRDWFGELSGRDVLCLASGGGQQAPVLAAAGARVVSFDLSEEQLSLDRYMPTTMATRALKGETR